MGIRFHEHGECCPECGEDVGVVNVPSPDDAEGLAVLDELDGERRRAGGVWAETTEECGDIETILEESGEEVCVRADAECGGETLAGELEREKGSDGATGGDVGGDGLEDLEGQRGEGRHEGHGGDEAANLLSRSYLRDRFRAEKGRRDPPSLIAAFDRAWLCASQPQPNFAIQRSMGICLMKSRREPTALAFPVMAPALFVQAPPCT